MAKLTVEDGEIGDRFGHSVSIFDVTIAVGAAGDNLGAADDQVTGFRSGSVNIFDRNDDSGQWDQKTKLLASNAASTNYKGQFGWATSMSENVLVVGAPNARTSTGWSGSVYLFEKSAH
jgi:hypothetical protein